MPVTSYRKREHRQAIESEALSRARGGMSGANYAAIIRGFMDKGIAADQIEPRVNVFTYHAWRALGRQVRKGEHGVQVITFIPMVSKRDRLEAERTGKAAPSKSRPSTTTVFHISQTDELAAAIDPVPAATGWMPNPIDIEEIF